MNPFPTSPAHFLKWLDERPRVIATLMGPGNLLRQARKARRDGAEILELRVDSLRRIDLKSIGEIIGKVKSVSRRPVITTVRDPKEQGPVNHLLRLDNAERIRLFAACMSRADCVDVEIESPIAPQIVKVARKSSVKVILSHHDFKRLPDASKVRRLVVKFKKMKGDVLKIAGYSDDRSEVLNYLRECILLGPIRRTFIAMGEAGKLSRMAGFCFGSCLTYGFVGTSAAPGQVPVKDLVQIYKNLESKH